MKFFNILFPLFDYLYIYQNLEYESYDFLKWYFKYPFKRGLQKKHKLKLTSKALALAALSLLLIWLTSQFMVARLNEQFFASIIFIVLLSQITPLFLVVAQIIFFPAEHYKRTQIIGKAKNRLKELNNLKRVAIVGSFAKTSTKNMLYTLLWKDFRVIKTPKSYNTQVSIARTILSDLKDSTDIFIAEMDAYHKGDIGTLAELVGPDMGVITGIAPQHLEKFGNMEKLAKTQFEIAGKLKDGLLFLHSGDGWEMKLEGDYPIKKVFYGLRKEDDYRAEDVKQTEYGVSFTLHVNSSNGMRSLNSSRLHSNNISSVTIDLPLKGEHQVINFLAAAAIANKLGLDLKKIQQRASLILPTEHRLEIRRLGSLTLIDNTYNTNPVSSRSSLKLLASYRGKQKILITPGLVELGDDSFKENLEFAKEASRVADDIIVVGEHAKKPMLQGLDESGFSMDKIHKVGSTKEGLKLIEKIASKEAVVLLENDLPDQYF